MLHKVGKELCKSCKFRSGYYAFRDFNRCEYALVTEKCRLDPPGTCSHYLKDENYDPNSEEEKREKRIEAMRIRRERMPKSKRPVGRPKKREEDIWPL
jgi:hypothetical protein